ncbi:MAG: hypothetical protein K8F92_05440 [Hyphomicrobium sp.]|nr:MAG: hypothetical protein F9K20_12550 [Hyphomicrobium sp.]MBZ0209080.1 hypothetical protein [Hyphomicrobium sp.]
MSWQQYEVRGINRVVYDIASTPRDTVEWA